MRWPDWKLYDITIAELDHGGGSSPPGLGETSDG
jgi:hypothetical protein